MQNLGGETGECCECAKYRKALEQVRSVAHYGNELTIEEACMKLNHCENTAIGALDPTVFPGDQGAQSND